MYVVPKKHIFYEKNRNEFPRNISWLKHDYMTHDYMTHDYMTYRRCHNNYTHAKG